MNNEEMMHAYMRSEDAFRTDAHSPGMWCGRAFILFHAATVLRDSYLATPGGDHLEGWQETSVRGPELLLTGYAFECALKAILNAEIQSTENGPLKYVGREGHILNELADEVAELLSSRQPRAHEVTEQILESLLGSRTARFFTDSDREVFALLTGFIVYEGRYPTPRTPAPRGAPPWSKRPIWTRRLDPVTEALWERLRNAALIAASTEERFRVSKARELRDAQPPDTSGDSVR